MHVLTLDFIPATEWNAGPEYDYILLDALIAAGYFKPEAGGFRRTPLEVKPDYPTLIEAMIEDLSPPTLLGSIIVGCNIPPDLGIMAIQIKRAQRNGEVPKELASSQIYAPLLEVADKIQSIYRSAFDAPAVLEFEDTARAITTEILDIAPSSLDVQDIYEDIQKRKAHLASIF